MRVSGPGGLWPKWLCGQARLWDCPFHLVNYLTSSSIQKTVPSSDLYLSLPLTPWL